MSDPHYQYNPQPLSNPYGSGDTGSDVAARKGTAWIGCLLAALVIFVLIGVGYYVYSSGMTGEMFWQPGPTVVVRLEPSDPEGLQAAIAALKAKEKAHELDGEGAQTLAQLQRDWDARQSLFAANEHENLAMAADVFTRRFEGIGIVARASVVDGRVHVQLPAGTDITEDIERLIVASGQLLFRMEAVKDGPEFENLTLADNPNPARYRWVPMCERIAFHEWATDESGRAWLLVDFISPADPRLGGEHLERVYPTTAGNGELALGFEFAEGHAGPFGRLTDKYREDNFANGEAPRLCIIFNGEVFWAGVIKDRINGAGVMSGFDTADEQREMIALLRAGALPATAVIENIVPAGD